MENQTDKIYKSKKCVREAMIRYKKNMKENNPDKYNEVLKFHRAYNKQYYNKIKEERALLKQLLQKTESKP